MLTHRTYHWTVIRREPDHMRTERELHVTLDQVLASLVGIHVMLTSFDTANWIIGVP